MHDPHKPVEVVQIGVPVLVELVAVAVPLLCEAVAVLMFIAAGLVWLAVWSGA